MKLAAFTCISVTFLIISGFGRSREVKRVPDWDQTSTGDTQINPDKTSVSLRDSIVSFGMKLLGTPYVEGACNKDGFDCSGFVYFVFRHFKIKIPRSTSQFRNFGKEIPVDSIRKGDILLFLSPSRNDVGHVGIVTNPKGKESDFIHASSGCDMRVIISSLKQESYYRRYVKALSVF